MASTKQSINPTVKTFQSAAEFFRKNGRVKKLTISDDRVRITGNPRVFGRAPDKWDLKGKADNDDCYSTMGFWCQKADLDRLVKMTQMADAKDAILKSVITPEKYTNNTSVWTVFEISDRDGTMAVTARSKAPSTQDLFKIVKTPRVNLLKDYTSFVDNISANVKRAAEIGSTDKKTRRPRDNLIQAIEEIVARGQRVDISRLSVTFKGDTFTFHGLVPKEQSKNGRTISTVPLEKDILISLNDKPEKRAKVVEAVAIYFAFKEHVENGTPFNAELIEEMHETAKLEIADVQRSFDASKTAKTGKAAASKSPATTKRSKSPAVEKPKTKAAELGTPRVEAADEEETDESDSDKPATPTKSPTPERASKRADALRKRR